MIVLFYLFFASFVAEKRLSVRTHPMGRGVCHCVFSQRSAQFPRGPGGARTTSQIEAALLLYQSVAGK